MGLVEVKAELAQKLPWHKARVKFLASFIVAIFQVKTVNLSEIALALNPKAKILSNYRRLQRFFAQFELDDDLIARWVISLIPRPKAGYSLVLERHCSVKRLLAHLTIGQSQTLKRRYTVLGLSVYLSGVRLSPEDWLIVATVTYPHTQLSDYAHRWSIETLFGCLKSRGFRFEETHLIDPDRLSKMVALLALLTLWAFKVGQWQHAFTPIQKKTWLTG